MEGPHDTVFTPKRLAFFKMILLDLFSGAGGFSKAAIDAGLPVTQHYFSEIKQSAINNYQYNFPYAKPLGGITAIGAQSIGRAGVLSPYIDLDNYDIRRLTPVECERLQGFPDNWTKYGINPKNGQMYELSDTARYQLMGNAITKTIAEAIFRKILNSSRP